MIANGQLNGAQLENKGPADTYNVKSSGSVYYDTDIDSVVVFDYNGKALHLETIVLIGTAAQKTKGLVQYQEDELQDAITAAPAGSTIKLMAGTFTDNLVIDKKIRIIGKDETSIIDGTVDFQTGSDYSSIERVRFNQDVTIDSGVEKVKLLDGFIDTAANLTDNNPNSNCNLYLLARV